eukprot:jgi/Orpsp1_1/1187903/evm.model.d7180000061022.1
MVSVNNFSNTRRTNNIYSFDLAKSIIDSRRVDLLEISIENGLDVELNDDFGESLLEYALSSYNLPMAFYLVKFGANPQPIIDNPLSNLIIAHDGNLDILKTVVAHGLDINRQDKDGGTLLSIAIHEGKLDMIEYLINHGADLSLTSWEGTYSEINKNCHYN